jgi:hypothetical protein
MDPVYHYVRCGSRQGFDPNPYFDGASYLARHPEIEDCGENALLHALETGNLFAGQ